MCKPIWFFKINFIFSTEKKNSLLQNITQNKYLMNDKDLNALNSLYISNNLNKYNNFLRYGKWILNSVLELL